MEGRLDVETSNRPCGRISRSLAFAATGKGEAWTRHSKGPKPLRRTPMSNSPARRERPPVLNPLNRRIRTRMSGGVGGGRGEVSPYPDCGLIYCLAASPGSPLGPAGPIAPVGPAGPGGPAGPAGPGRPQFCISTSLLSSPEVISTMQVEGNSGPIHLNPPVRLLSTCPVLLGLILICTLGSRGCLILPTITNSPPDMAAVVINTSARAFSPHVITQAVVTAMTARISFASMASPCILSEC